MSIEKLHQNIAELLPELAPLSKRKRFADVSLKDLDRPLHVAMGFSEASSPANLLRYFELDIQRKRSTRQVLPGRYRSDAPLMRPKESFWTALQELHGYFEHTSQSRPKFLDNRFTQAGLNRFTKPLRDQIIQYQADFDKNTFRDLVERELTENDLPFELIETLHSEWPYAKSRLPVPSYVKEGFRDTLKAIWQYLQKVDQVDDAVLDLPLTKSGLEKFLDQFWMHISDYWPLCTWFEEATYETDNPLTDHNYIPFYLPSIHYDEELADMLIGFLTGPEGIAGLLTAIMDGEYFDLDETPVVVAGKDQKLIEEVGLKPLLEVYSSAEGKKTVPVAQLDDHWGSYFKEVQEKYPAMFEQYEFYIASDHFEEMTVTSAEDIEFAFAYYNAWYSMMGDIPNGDFMQEGEGVREFISEVCDTYRKTQKRTKKVQTNNKELLHENISNTA